MQILLKWKRGGRQRQHRVKCITKTYYSTSLRLQERVEKKKTKSRQVHRQIKNKFVELAKVTAQSKLSFLQRERLRDLLIIPSLVVSELQSSFPAEPSGDLASSSFRLYFKFCTRKARRGAPSGRGLGDRSAGQHT